MEPVEQTGPESVVFRAGRAGNRPECLPTAYKPQLITRRSLVQVQPPQPNKKGTPDLLSVYKAVSEKHTETGIAGQKREYESKGSYSFSVYTIKTTIGTLAFPKNLL